MPEPVIPNFFVIGAPKAGTTALAQYLAEHPNAFVCTPKEPFYLCTDYPHLKEQHALGSHGDYLALFEGGRGQVAVGEASTNYLRSETAVENALELNSDARFICLLRDPVEIAHAFHSEQLYARNETVESFAEAWGLQEARAEGRQIPSSCRAPEFLQYRQVASIGSQLSRVTSIIPEGQLLVLFQSDLSRDTGAVYRAACDFLGLHDDGRSDFPRVNSSHRHRSELLARIVLSPPAPLARPVNQIRQHLRVRRPWYAERVKRWQKVVSSRDAIAPELEAELRSFYGPEVAEVERLTGRDLSEWTTDCGSGGL
ncbi:MAG: sulfotransferase domain-containing protein [Actinomycetota bacterium]